jgi:hypothetical protein
MLTLNLLVSICYQYSKIEQKQIEQHIWKKYFSGVQRGITTDRREPACLKQSGRLSEAKFHLARQSFYFRKD